ncbi:MAG: response regulator [Pseudomonadota bacterium]
MAERLYIADDNDAFRTYVRRVAEGVDWEVTECPNGFDLMQALSDADSADLIMLDITMPEMDGIETVLKLRENETRSPICFVTGGPSVHAMTARLIAEADDFDIVGVLTKPISVDELLSVLDRVRRDIAVARGATDQASDSGDREIT